MSDRGGKMPALRRAALVVGASVAVASAAAVSARHEAEHARCGPGFVPRGPLCAVSPDAASHAHCPAPLVASLRGCAPPDLRVFVPAATWTVGASDWEAEGQVPARTIVVSAFRIAAFEATRDEVADGGEREEGDRARAATGLSRDEAAAFCARRGGRLPTEDEWIAAALSGNDAPRRYPWGDTGAVCRRAAWGLAFGPCADGASGADVVGAHPGGDSAIGIHDLAGNAAEWVADAPVTGAGRRPAPAGMAKGGSWQSRLAAELRIWARIELDPDAHDPRVGARCAYPP